MYNERVSRKRTHNPLSFILVPMTAVSRGMISGVMIRHDSFGRIYRGLRRSLPGPIFVSERVVRIKVKVKHTYIEEGEARAPRDPARVAPPREDRAIWRAYGEQQALRSLSSRV